MATCGYWLEKCGMTACPLPWKVLLLTQGPGVLEAALPCLAPSLGFCLQVITGEWYWCLYSNP